MKYFHAKRLLTFKKLNCSFCGHEISITYIKFIFIMKCQSPFITIQKSIHYTIFFFLEHYLKISKSRYFLVPSYLFGHLQAELISGILKTDCSTKENNTVNILPVDMYKYWM